MVAWLSVRRVAVFGALVLAQQMGAPNGVEAATVKRQPDCPPAAVGGRPIGEISIDGRQIPMVAIARTKDGILNPPATSAAAGLDTEGVPLDASHGTAVIAWHVRFGKGCPGALNPISRAPLGTRFTIESRTGGEREYVVTGRDVSRADQLPARWFRLSGPYRVGLFTCGDLRDGQFHSTVATFATPVDLALLEPGNDDRGS